MRRFPVMLASTLVGVTALSGCGDTLGVGGPQNFALLFSVSGAPADQAPARVLGPSDPAAIVGPPMVLSGSNGTLTIDEIRLIVAEVELEGDDDDCGPADDDDCNDFDVPPTFLDLPLDGQPVQAVVGMIPAGTYDELEFEIEDLDDDGDDDFQAEIALLRTQIRSEFPDWPDDASVMVAGTFSTTDAETPFRVYIDAEIEIERELRPPLVVTDDAEAIDLTVDIRADLWFVRSNGTVIDLSVYDWSATGELLELEVEIEDGFMEVEFDDES